MMFEIETLISIVCDALDDEKESREYNRKIRKRNGYAPDAVLWIGSLRGPDAYRLGEMSGRCARNWRTLADVCDMLDIDRELLIAAVKSMQRKERHNGRWDNPNYTTWIGYTDKERLVRFLANDKAGLRT